MKQYELKLSKSLGENSFDSLTINTFCDKDLWKDATERLFHTIIGACDCVARIEYERYGNIEVARIIYKEL